MNSKFESVASRLELVSYAASDLKGLYEAITSSDYELEFVVFYADGGVTIKKVTSLSSAQDLVDLGRFKEIRAFNGDVELHLVYDGASNRFIGRIRVDGNVEDVARVENLAEIKVLDEEHVLWGYVSSNKTTDDAEFILEEDRGTRIVMPRIAENVKDRSLITVLVRNYLVDQVGSELSFAFDDYRFVKFLVREGK